MSGSANCLEILQQWMEEALLSRDYKRYISMQITLRVLKDAQLSLN